MSRCIPEMCGHVHRIDACSTHFLKWLCPPYQSLWAKLGKWLEVWQWCFYMGVAAKRKKKGKEPTLTHNMLCQWEPKVEDNWVVLVRAVTRKGWRKIFDKAWKKANVTKGFKCWSIPTYIRFRVIWYDIITIMWYPVLC